jgi:hypothetical protein
MDGMPDAESGRKLWKAAHRLIEKAGKGLGDGLA